MRHLAIAWFAAILAGCAVTQVGGVIHPTISGEIVLTTVEGAQSHWMPDRCVSGDIAYFAGFDFLSARDNGHLRAALNPIDGPVVRWSSNDALGDFLIVRRADCTQLDLDVQPTAWTVNNVREFAGHIALQCTGAGGVRIEGRIEVDHCH